MVTILFIPLFIVRLLLINIGFVGQLVLLELKRLSSRYLVLIILYLILFGQALLLLSTTKQVTNTRPSPLQQQQLAKQKIDLSKANTYCIKTSESAIKQEQRRYNSDYIPDQHRDMLINQALLQLAANNESEYNKLVLQAKQLDPNWVGWR